MTSFRGKHIQTVDECRFILGLLLKEISECPYKKKHLDGLRNSIMSENVARTAAQIIEDEARENLL